MLQVPVPIPYSTRMIRQLLLIIQALRATVDSFQIEADAFTSAFTPGQAVTLYAQSGGITMTASAEL